METKQCKDCNQIKNISDFHPCGKYKDKVYYRGECIECSKTYLRSDKAKETQKKYRLTNKYKEVRKSYRAQPGVRDKELARDRTTEGRRKKAEQKKKLYYSDPLNNLKVKLRARFRNSLKSKNLDKQKSVANLIGISLPDFKIYLEKQFKFGMSWEDTSSYHIDHIIPLDSAKTEEEMYKLWHYTNLQPLYPIENLKKSSKVS